jgi:hypothetical protein
MPRGSVLPRRTSRRPRLRCRLAVISAFSAISATGSVDRRQGPRHDLARRPAGKTGNSFAPLQGPGKGFPTFPTFPPDIWPPAERVVQAADDARAAALEAPMLMKVIPIPCRRRSAFIRHNIAQFCQARSVAHGAREYLRTGGGGGVSSDITGCREGACIASKSDSSPSRIPRRGGARVAGGGVMTSPMTIMAPERL